jgi:RNA polymerase sigma-70 factor (ECF subfamily)
MPHGPESAILSRLARVTPREGEPSALEEEVVSLFDQMRDRLLRYLLTFRMLVVQDGEEIVQEAFLALFRHLQEGKSRHNLQGWLFRVAHNLALKRIQRTRKDSQNLVDLRIGAVEFAPDPAPNPEDAFAHSQSYQRVSAVIDAMPEQDRQCLALRAEGMRYREIAEVLDISLGSVAKTLERSLARIARANAHEFDGDV